MLQQHTFRSELSATMLVCSELTLPTALEAYASSWRPNFVPLLCRYWAPSKLTNFP